MPIQIQEINDENESMDCPLCMEPFEVDDINFFPCICGYQICRFCWHRIRTDENGLCPACRTSYPENPAEFKPLTGSDLQKIKNEKKQKEVQRKQKLTDNRRHLAAIRVLQRNLVFVVGLSQRLSDPEVLKRQEYFGKYGKILKVVINNNTTYAGTQGPSSSAYVTYSKMEEALRAIQSVNNVHIDGRTLKASLGTTKYCSTYLKNQQCHKTDCMYLHELADEESSFTKEDMQAGKHQELEHKLIEQMRSKEEADPNSSSTNLTPSNGAEITERRTRRHSGSVQHPGGKRTESSWAAAALTGGGSGVDQGPAARLSSSLDDKSAPSHARTANKGKKKSAREAARQNSKLEEESQTPSLPAYCRKTPPVDVSPAPAASNSLGTNDSGFSQNSPETEDTGLEFPPRPTSIPLPADLSNDVSAIADVFATKATSDHNDVLTQGLGHMQITSQDNLAPETSPFSRLRQPEALDASSSLLLSSVFNPVSNNGHCLWNLHSQSTEPDVTPVPPRASSWEAAFGFGRSSLTTAPGGLAGDAGDDDLGFDPWTECNKGFTDLIERESVSQQYQSQTPPPPGLNLKPNPFPRLSEFDAKQPRNTGSDFLPRSLQNSLFAPAPPPVAHRGSPLEIQLEKEVRGPNGLNEWKNGLRALLPSVNINFAMDSTPPSSSNAPGFVRLSAAHISPPAGHSLPNTDRWGDYTLSSSQMNASSLFPNFPGGTRQQSAFFHQNRFGQQAPEQRLSTIGPPPGLSFDPNPVDPAIIASGSKPPASVPVNQQPSAQEETPHWMKSLQALTDCDSPTSPNAGQPLSVDPPATQSTFSAWPLYAGTALPPISNAPPPNPPPGFQSRLPYTSSNDFTLRHNLLENKS